MALHSRTSQPSAADGTNNEAPLLSHDGRDFLEGKIDADKYVDATRQLAADRARLDLYKFLRSQRKRRSTAVVGLILATIAYATLGVATLISGKGIISVVALVTALVAALVALGYGHYRDGNDNDDPHEGGGTGGVFGTLFDWLVLHEFGHVSRHHRD